ncbi:hypothetical protein CEXT_619251 [Caerostris extrusa]|uniref:Uncharacterized protein n=1 Tax=Caerostris extrusa TaxID=172846 RepID=A0AAV4S882_CAEEX|nr:hypothetical protein CEXT_619251 [Caerostris extrusa]
MSCHQCCRSDCRLKIEIEDIKMKPLDLIRASINTRHGETRAAPEGMERLNIPPQKSTCVRLEHSSTPPLRFYSQCFAQMLLRAVQFSPQ